MSAGRVRQGGVFVEIGADARKFFATLDRVNKSVGKVGASIAGIGGRMAGVGAGLAAPFVASAMAGARFQDVLLNVQASTGATAAEIDQVKKAALSMSQALGVGPTEAAAGFLELLKAGMSLEQVLGGAGEAAIAFAKVGGMAVADAAVVMADAMNVFKVSGDVAANTLSAAADASSTSIEGIAQAFSQVSAVAGLANQSIQDTAAALAVLANAGIKGSDAGTSLKTMLMRLMAPADDAVGALEQVGLSVQSFRNADGTMKPMVEIIGTLSTALEGMDQAAKDDIFRRIFGSDAIRAAAVMTSAGVDGFNAMRDGMAGAMTVGQKFATMNSGLSGALAKLFAAMERLAIAVSDAVAPALMALAGPITAVVNGFASIVSNNQELVANIAKGVAVFSAVGAVLVGVGG
jgi:TP901 family phage tail tape measure protein